MNRKTLQQLILHIVSYVEEIGGYTTTIRLVKYLYLIDLEHYRRYTRTLTGLQWIFYLYGPYCFALTEIGRSIGFDLTQEEFESQKGRKGRLYKASELVELPKELGHSVETMIDGLLDIWGLEETQTLLEYVYRTDPMVNAVRGQELNFDVVPHGSRYYELYFPIDKKLTLKISHELQSLREEDEKEFIIPNTKRDEAFIEGIKALQEEDDDSDFSGISHTQISTDELRNSLPEGE